VIAEVEFLHDPGEIAADSVHTPGLYVDAVVRSDMTYCGKSLSACD
jgi:acyl CoA:acetate/3-ketoacid CoA transferase alpha subunit